MIGRDRILEIDLDALTARVAEPLRLPGRARVAVERAVGPVLGPIRVRVAVRGRHDALHSHLLGRRQRRGLLAGEHLEARVGGIGRQRRVGGARLFGEANGLGHGGPTPRPQTVVVGDDENVAGSGRAPKQRVGRVRRRVPDHTGTVEQTDVGGVDQTLAVAAHHQRVISRLTAHYLGRVRDGIHLHRSDGRRRRRSGQADLVAETRRQREVGRRSVARRRAQPGRGLQHRGEILRAHEVVTLVVDVIARDHVADAHPAPQRGETRGIGHALLQPAIDRVQQVGASGCAVRDQLTGHVGPIGETRRDRIDRVPPRVRREVGTRLLQDAGLVVAPVERGDCFGPVARELLVALQVLAVERSVDQRGEVDEDQDPDEHGHRVRERTSPPRAQPSEHRVRREAEEDRRREHDERRRPTRAPQRQTRGRRVRERLEQPTERGRGVVGMRPDRDHDADEQQENEEDAMTPAQERGREQRQHDEAIAREDDPGVLRVVARRLDPRTETILAVEEPVAEAAQHLVRRRRERDRLDGLAVLQDVEAVRALHAQARDPPQRREQRQPTGTKRHTQRAAGIDFARDQPRVEDPQHRAHARVDQRGRVDAADDLDDEGEDRGIAPTLLPQGLADDGDHPRQRGPGHEQYRDARRVVEHVRRAHERERSDDDAGSPQAEGTQQEQDAEGRREQQRTEPKALRYPRGRTELLEHPVVGTHRERVPDRLVRDAAHADVGIPHRHRSRQQPARIEIQILLGVGADLPGRGQ